MEMKSLLFEQTVDYFIVSSEPELNSKDMDECLAQVEEFFTENPNAAQSTVIFDFSKLVKGLILPRQIEKLTSIMNEHLIEFFITVRPMGKTPEVFQVTQMLNKSIPYFHHHGIYIFIVGHVNEATALVKQVMKEDFKYQIYAENSNLITIAPRYLLREIVDKYLVEIDDHLDRVAGNHERNVIMDFRPLKQTNMEPSQMLRFVMILGNHNIKNVIVIPPKEETEENNGITKLLNKALPYFHREGIHVDFADDVMEAAQTIRKFEDLK